MGFLLGDINISDRNINRDTLLLVVFYFFINEHF